MTLKEAMPYEFCFCDNKKIRSFDNVQVIWKQDTLSDNLVPWPGKHKYVNLWVKLANGYAVGLNENPSKGFTFCLFKMAN